MAGFTWVCLGSKEKTTYSRGSFHPIKKLVFGRRILVSGEHELTIGAGIAIPESQSSEQFERVDLDY